jgi:hypothetical protein
MGDPSGREPQLARRDRCADGERTSHTRGEDTAWAGERPELKQRTIDRVRRFLTTHVPMRAAAQ